MIGNHYPTDRLRGRIDKVSNSMLENGLLHWHPEYYKYLNDMKTGFKLSREHDADDDDNDSLHSLTFEQMIRPFYLCIGLLIISILVFVGEIIISKWKARRDRMY